MKKRIELYLPQTVYSEALIDRAILDYRSICMIMKKRQRGGTLCIFIKSVADLELTANEFSNYLMETRELNSSSCLFWDITIPAPRIW